MGLIQLDRNKPVSSGTDAPTKNAISLTPFYYIVWVLGQRKSGSSGLPNLHMNGCRKSECITTPYSTDHQSITGGKPVTSGTDGPTKNPNITCCGFGGKKRDAEVDH